MPKGKTEMKGVRNKESLACRHQKKKPNQNKNKSKHLLPAIPFCHIYSLQGENREDHRMSSLPL
ncbi:hypothetical protein I7I53_02946 [Histoplasma capsulatum var. duboisii H88]|uniref:Uncharacterized protein n=1 Tax=Ajellomyces capsulatus (strain H88) TaxID=544711 RepID=A0A8A1LPW1_AJEC8|nr:hypothetical protein I7I53_02946 [Histoplasma capsulatum var. duboisii H88]